VLGHSWGGMLAMAYAITKPPGLVSLLVHGSPASMPFALAEVDKLRASLQPVLCLALLSRETGQERHSQGAGRRDRSRGCADWPGPLYATAGGCRTSRREAGTPVIVPVP